MRRILSGTACLCAALGCQSFVGEYTADLDETGSAGLCAVDRTLSFDLDLESDEAQESLAAYYEAANPELVESLTDIAQRFADGEPEGKVTYLRGAAGIGKSFVTGSITDGFDASELCEVELADLFASSVEDRGFEVELRPDLTTTDGTHVFNVLPAISAPSEFDVETLLEAVGCFDDGELRPLIVLDGIDELHDDASRLILERVDEYILGRDHDAIPFVHFLISGRPEGFASWLSAPERKLANTNIEEHFELQGPKYATSGDLSFRVESYLAFVLGDDLTEEILADYTESFTQALIEHPFLRYTTSNLAFGNLVIDRTAPGLDASERALKTRLFDDFLARNVQTHGRPGANTKFDGAYRRALEDIAARYVDVDARGSFNVSSDDTVECFDDEGESLGRLRVRDVLNRSGVAVLPDPRLAAGSYRFDPFWLHAHLVERRNQRLDPNYRYRTCD